MVLLYNVVGDGYLFLPTIFIQEVSHRKRTRTLLSSLADVVYVSRYSPVVILELSATEVNQLALNSKVETISSMGDDEYVDLSENQTSESVNETIAPYSTTSSALPGSANEGYTISYTVSLPKTALLDSLEIIINTKHLYY